MSIPKLVIIIDDDEDDIEMMKYVFKKANVNIHCISFYLPIEAISRLSKAEYPIPDYVFIDINMPLMSGPECLFELRKLDKFENVPIIIYSTYLPMEIGEDLMKKGATFAFQKPNDMGWLRFDFERPNAYQVI